MSISGVSWTEFNGTMYPDTRDDNFVAYSSLKIFYEFSQLPKFCNYKLENNSRPQLECLSEELDDLELIGRELETYYLRLSYLNFYPL